MSERTGVRALKFVFADLIGDFFTFPLWWYTRGLAKMIAASGRQIMGTWARLGVGVWVRNIFVPMFGQADIPGRIISFFMRVFQIIVRSVGFIFAIAFQIVLLLLWIAVPLFITVMIVTNFVNLFRA